VVGVGGSGALEKEKGGEKRVCLSGEARWGRAHQKINRDRVYAADHATRKRGGASRPNSAGHPSLFAYVRRRS